MATEKYFNAFTFYVKPPKVVPTPFFTSTKTMPVIASRGSGPLQFSEQRNKCAFSTNAQSRFVLVVLDDVLGPPRLALLDSL